MKIAVFSDTHKHIGDAARVIDREQPDLVIHLGDHIRDAYALAGQFPHTPMECVPGNCDYAPTVPQSLTLEFDGVRIFMTHGHIYGVKRDLTALTGAAKDAGAQLALFGHTHIQHMEERDGLTLLNPGAAGRFGRSGYAVVEIKDGVFSCRLETDTE